MKPSSRPFGFLFTSGLIAIAFGFARADAEVMSPAGAPIVFTHDGPLRGFTTERMFAFDGIPYATPPVGALRWRPPEVHPPWRTVRDATHFGKHCAQNSDGKFGTKSLAEDCLFLNIYTPQAKLGGLPVMFWIHGGGFTSGESDDYDPNRLVPQGVIVVTINYRLGLLGFFAQSGIDKEAHALMNYGLMDQQRALAWVHRNIGAFGGDPRRVTIFGESAGGLSVLSQIASPGASGLFAAAIAESGDYQTTLPSLASEQTTGDNIAANLGCTSEQASCVRALPVSALLKATASENLPAVDGVVLPRSVQQAFPSGRFNRVPVINGSNHDEFRLFTASEFDLGANGPLTKTEYPGVLAFLFGSLEPKVLAQYPLKDYHSPDLAFSALMTDWVFSCQTRQANDALSRLVPTFSYEFADEKAPENFLPPVSFKYGATHASELQFLWDEFIHRHPTQLGPNEHILAADMVSYWTTFAKNANPNGGGVPEWPAYVAGYDDVNSLIAPNPQVIYDFATFHRCSFWKSFPPANIACIISGNCQAGSLQVWRREMRGRPL